MSAPPPIQVVANKYYMADYIQYNPNTDCTGTLYWHSGVVCTNSNGILSNGVTYFGECKIGSGNIKSLTFEYSSGPYDSWPC